jgi:hypothetical protein
MGAGLAYLRRRGPYERSVRVIGSGDVSGGFVKVARGCGSVEPCGHRSGEVCGCGRGCGGGHCVRVSGRGCQNPATREPGRGNQTSRWW